jgi:hypothetical protein
MQSTANASTTSLVARTVKGLGLVAVALTMAAWEQGCAVDTGAGDDSEVGVTEDDISKAAASLVGSYGRATQPGNAAALPAFTGLVLQANGKFFADIDTGVRCITTPCPSAERIEGSFRATKTSLTLTAAAGSAPSQSFGKYTYRVGGRGLELTRQGWANTLPLVNSYCAASTDCDEQGIIHPMCVGAFTCTASNACAYKCGVMPVDNAVWPADALEVTATASGGFMAPAPAGSKCTLSHQRYTFTPATNTLRYETCANPGQGRPFELVTGTTVPNAAELRAIRSAAKLVVITKADICGADKPFEQLTVKTAAGTKSYTDSFYSCRGGQNAYIDNLGAVLSAFRSAAH